MTNIDIEQQSVEFDVSELGVPVLVRVSYFPNWNVEGAEGPYRIGPNQMVVVPTDTHVKLSYGRSKSDVGFYALTLFGIAGAVFLRRRGDVTFATLSPPAAAAPPPDLDPTPSSIDPIWDDDRVGATRAPTAAAGRSDRPRRGPASTPRRAGARPADRTNRRRLRRTDLPAGSTCSGDMMGPAHE